MLINVLLSTFGVVLRGINTGFNYFDTKLVISSCWSQTRGEFLNCTDLSSIHDNECEGDPSCEVKKPEDDIGTRERESFPVTTLTTPMWSRIPTDSYTNATPTLSSPMETSQKLETTTPLPETSQTPTINQTCETGFTGTFPDCRPIKCQSPSMGIYPNCFIPPCPPRYSGTYPECKRPTDQICPFGSTGSFPNCVTIVRNCPEGSICDDVIVEPLLQSTQATPSTSSERPLTDFNQIEWEDFKRMFNKTYTNHTIEHNRRQIFLRNQDIVDAHNMRFDRGLESYFLAINEFSDQTYDEVIAVDPLKQVVDQKQDAIVSVTENVENDAKIAKENITSDRSGYNK